MWLVRGGGDDGVKLSSHQIHHLEPGVGHVLRVCLASKDWWLGLCVGEYGKEHIRQLQLLDKIDFFN